MVRTLFLVSGSLRTFKDNIQYLPSACEIAVYSSFREDDTYFNLTDTRFLFEDTRIKIVLFESEIDVPDIFKDERQRNMYKQWFKLQRLFSSVPATYDTYVRIRPDVRLTRPGQLETLLTNQTTTLRIPIGNDRSDINTITKDHFPAINDQVCIASYDGMAHYCKVINHLMPFEGSPADRLSGFLSEQVLAAHLSMPVERVVLDYKLVLSSVKVVAISGDSGSGKSTLCSLIRPLFLFDKVLEFETDRYHKWERNDEHWKTTSHLDPTSNYLEKLEEDTFNLKLGNSIIAVDYDHSTGRFTAPQTVTSNDNVILCGLHTLYSESMRGLTDIKIFMDTDPELSTEWKIQRDVNQRGYPIESVLQKINERRLDYNKFILPQKDHADVIIRHVKEGLEVLVRRIFSLPAISGCVITHTTTHSVLTCKDPHITVESEISAFLAERSLPKIKSQPGYSGVIQLVILAILYK